MADYGNMTITALAGGAKAGASALLPGLNRITVCATAGDSVTLPTAQIGLSVVVINAGATVCQVFGLGTVDTVNGSANATGFPQAPGTKVEYICSVNPVAQGTPVALTAANWETGLAGGQKAAIITLAVSGAIQPRTSATYALNKAGVAAMTLAAPTATTDDGVTIVIYSDSANAHTLTATALLDTGSANAAIATFANSKGSGLTLQAFNGRWKVLSQIGITFT